MKAYFAAVVSLFAATALLAAPPKTKSTDPVNDAQLYAPGQTSVLTVKKPTPNQIAGHKVVYSGIAVQVIKTKNPINLVNPWAPAEYGTGDCNLERDTITAKPVGFRFLSISF
jgi:hypothetical protein